MSSIVDDPRTMCLFLKRKPFKVGGVCELFLDYENLYYCNLSFSCTFCFDLLVERNLVGVGRCISL